VDSVEAALEGFGAHRPDRPRIKPLPEATPLPDAPVRRRRGEGSTTSPGRRQIETRKRTGYILLTLLCVGVAIFVAWRMSASSTPETVSTSTNATLPPPAPTPTPTETIQGTSVPVENLAPVPSDMTPKPLATTKPTVTAKATTTAPTVTAPATTTAPASSGVDPKNDVKRTM
jgi:hypothetical protein